MVELETAAELLFALECFSAWKQRLTLLNGGSGLDSFLQHTWHTVPYYQRLWKHPPLTLDAISSIPYDEYRLRNSEFRSSAFPPERLLLSHTSGTSGTSAGVWIDQAAYYHNNYFSLRVFARCAKPTCPLAVDDIAVLLVTNKPGRQPVRIAIPSLGFAQYRRAVLGRGDSSDLDVVKELRHKPPLILHGKASYLLHLLNVAEKALPNDPLAPVAAVVTSGEDLHDDVRRYLQRGLHSEIYDAYTSAEGGLIAIECQLHRGYHVQEHKIVEIRNDLGNISPTGEGELILTNLMNWGMPAVRLCTRDYGKVQKQQCACGFTGTTITNLIGKDTRCFSIAGQNIRAHLFQRIFDNIPVRDFRVCQISDREFEILAVPFSGEDDKLVIGKVHSAAIKMFKELRFSVRATDRICDRGAKRIRYESKFK